MSQKLPISGLVYVPFVLAVMSDNFAKSAYSQILNLGAKESYFVESSISNLGGMVWVGGKIVIPDRGKYHVG